MCQALALHYLGVCFRTVMCSECDVDVAELLRCTHRYINQPLQPENFSADMVTRPHVEADLYIGTSPCKDFSTAGANKGLKPISHARFPAERACQRFVGRFRWQELPANMAFFGGSKRRELWSSGHVSKTQIGPAAKTRKSRKHDAGFAASFEILWGVSLRERARSSACASERFGGHYGHFQIRWMCASLKRGFVEVLLSRKPCISWTWMTSNFSAAFDILNYLGGFGENHADKWAWLGAKEGQAVPGRGPNGLTESDSDPRRPVAEALAARGELFQIDIMPSWHHYDEATMWLVDPMTVTGLQDVLLLSCTHHLFTKIMPCRSIWRCFWRKDQLPICQWSTRNRNVRLFDPICAGSLPQLSPSG